MSSTGRKILIASVILSLAVGFGGGVLVVQHKLADSLPIVRELINRDLGKPEELDFALFWEVWDALNDKYVDPSKLDMQEMLYGAIEGMVNSVGDPYTVFFEPVISKKFQEEISGAFGGVGIEIGKRNDVTTVIAPLQDTPAYRAGILAGDKILKVNGKIVTDMVI